MGIRESVVSVAAARTVGDVIDALERLRPGSFDRLCEANGRVREHINVFVGAKNARLDGGRQLEIPPGAEVWIITSVNGG